MSERITTDLDALEPQPGELVLGGKTIPVTPPTTRQLLNLGRLFIRLAGAETDEQIDEILDQIDTDFIELIPQLKGKNLSVGQYRAILDTMNQMSVPPDIRELEKNGIKPATSSKKKVRSPGQKK